MFHRNHIVFLGAALFATLGACHSAKPVTSVSASSYQAQHTGVDAADQDPSARDVPGYAPSTRREPPQPTAQAPARTPAPAPALVPHDGSMRLFDMP